MMNLEYIEQLKKELKYDELYDYVMSYMDKEDPEAYYIYARWCHEGEIVDPDMSEAIKYYKKAIHLGHELARKDFSNYIYELANLTANCAIELIERDSYEDKLKGFKLFQDAKKKYSLAMHYGHTDACDKYFEIFDLIDKYRGD